ncbi:hypothetical protein BEN47_04585 [Hymenobacter lapidarius]|uniref:Uncharacterized protein n=1 Tax=Hymenobacter lapidarius TaxID=1908237 RepID=A0A1G1SVK5_9BACT|nr:hypothetical protein [Hymenobacter lapidarius]OGX82653.1 hypothetical protein BEN47_04585 [Hymenobacter lapidarius]
MLGKNPFRWFLFLVVAIVLAKLLYNLGYSYASRKMNSTTEAAPPPTQVNRQAQGLRGVTIDPADSVEAARMAAPIN